MDSPFASPDIFYFTDRIERPELSISCSLTATIIRAPMGGSSTEFKFGTLIERPSSSASVDSSKLQAELRANQEVLGRYSSLDRRDLAPELAEKRAGLDQRNKEIEALLKQVASLA